MNADKLNWDGDVVVPDVSSNTTNSPFGHITVF